ncbi:MAG: nitrile hydratase [Proteobacteria bacterium]|nr:MAG: nitrile hydratase [Pseudomonadota bacterium]
MSAPAPRFRIGDVVRVDSRMALGHCRTPFFLRGKTGVIVGIQGAFHDPEKLAYHKPGLPRQVLYKVRFKQSDLWPNYRGKPHDHLEADIYEHWLMRISAEARSDSHAA